MLVALGLGVAACGGNDPSPPRSTAAEEAPAAATGGVTDAGLDRCHVVRGTFA